MTSPTMSAVCTRTELRRIVQLPAPPRTHTACFWRLRAILQETTLAAWFLIGAAFTSTWTALSFHGIKPVDWYLVLALLALLPRLVAVRTLPPRWLWVSAGVIVII